MQAQTTTHTKPEESVDLEEMQTKALEGLKEVRGTVEEFAKTNPRTAVGIALGVGFILGGGLTPRLLFGLTAYAARRYARDYARAQIGNVTKGVFGGAGEDDGQTPDQKPGRAPRAVSTKDST
jgi:hypothetical protein